MFIFYTVILAIQMLYPALIPYNKVNVTSYYSTLTLYEIKAQNLWLRVLRKK